MKNQILTHGPRIPQKHLLKNSPAVHKEPVEIPVVVPGQFERQYAPDHTQKDSEPVELPPEHRPVKEDKNAKT